MFLAEPFGPRLLVISTAFLAFHVEQLHYKASVSYKYPAIRCKNNLERSTCPSNCKKILQIMLGYHNYQIEPHR
nr:hypothetical protein [Shewanella mesophila]